MNPKNMNLIELNRMQARIIGNLQQAFGASYEDGKDAFAMAIEELEQLKPYYQKFNEKELAED